MHRGHLRMNKNRQARAAAGSSTPCEVCQNAFDSFMQRPRTLPCGHTFCSLCINTLSRGGYIICPSCRCKHAVPLGGQFPINYTLESVVTPQGAGLSVQTRAMLQEQEAKVLAALTACQEAHTQLNQYEASLGDCSSQQQTLEKNLQSAMEHNRRAKNLVQQEKLRTAAKKREVNQEQQKLRAALQTLRNATTEQAAGTAFLDGTRCVDEAEGKAGECLVLLSDEGATATKEVMEASKGALNAVLTMNVVFEPALKKAEAAGSRQERQNNASRPFGGGGFPAAYRPQPSMTLPGMMQSLRVNPQPPVVKVDDVYSLRQPTRSLMETGRVYAVHQVQGVLKYARITVSGGSACLHSLQDQTPPVGASTLQMSELLPLLPPCLVFLELSWPGSAARQVRIRFSTDTPRARHFVLLCTGQWGASYAGTKLFAVDDKGGAVERVKGGDYERNDGKGGAALMAGLEEGEYKKTVSGGAVWCCGMNDPARGAQFAISTRSRTDGNLFGLVFGEVVLGLDVIAAAAHHRNIREVTVVDCGVVLRE